MILRNLIRYNFLKHSRKNEFLSHAFKLFKQQPVPKSTYFFHRFFCFVSLNFIVFAKAESIKPSMSKKEGKINVSVSTAISKADELFLIGKFKESYNVLIPYEDSDNVEILWRICRALYNMSKQKDITKKEHAEFITSAYDFINQALKLNDEHYAVHKWMAILVDAKGSLEGIKARIKALPLFKEHLLKAINLNPKDATSIYMLGQYMYNLADMSWVQLTLAKTLFGNLPEATFEEAFHYFSKAEETEPNFYSANLLMLGKTSLKLKRLETAHYWLKCATSYPVRTDEDEAVRLEAEELLKKYPQVKKEQKSYETHTVNSG